MDSEFLATNHCIVLLIRIFLQTAKADVHNPP